MPVATAGAGMADDAWLFASPYSQSLSTMVGRSPLALPASRLDPSPPEPPPPPVRSRIAPDLHEPPHGVEDAPGHRCRSGGVAGEEVS